MKEPIVEDPKAIAIIGGAQLAPQHLNILQTLTETFVAADSGADHLLAAGITPKAVIGDFDSLSGSSRLTFEPYLIHITEQDTTDLEKTLTCIKAPVIIGAGFLGGRLDHSFATFNAMVRFRQTPLILLSDSECCFRAPVGAWTIDLPSGTPFALLPMGEAVVSSTGLVWDMDRMTLSPTGRVSSSNKTAAPHVRVDVGGSVIVTLPLDQLGAAIDVVRVG